MKDEMSELFILTLFQNYYFKKKLIKAFQFEIIQFDSFHVIKVTRFITIN